MSIAGLLVSLLLAIIVIAIVAQPLLDAARGGIDAAEPDDRRDRVSVYYERVLTNIRDLDEDLATGKISPADHGREREVWVARGITLLRLLDQWQAEQHRADEATDIDAMIEAAVAAYREGQGSAISEEIS